MTKKAKHVSVVADDGTNYRLIAETMTELGFKMKHSSVHNHVLNILKRFAEAYADEFGVVKSDDELSKIVRNPSFQEGLADILRDIEAYRRNALR